MVTRQDRLALTVAAIFAIGFTLGVLLYGAP